jgi:hypothetical protein
MRKLITDAQPWMGHNFSLELNIPPLAGIVLKLNKVAE